MTHGKSEHSAAPAKEEEVKQEPINEPEPEAKTETSQDTSAPAENPATLHATRKTAIVLRIGSDRGFEEAAMRLDFVEIDHETKELLPQNLDWPLLDLNFYCQWEPGTTDHATHNWSLEYLRVDRVDLHRAETMVKMLRRIELAMGKLPCQPHSFGQFVTLVSLALKINDVVIISKNTYGEFTMPGSPDHSYGLMPIRGAQLLIDGYIAEFRDKNKK